MQQIGDIDTFDSSVRLTTGEWVRIGTENAGMLAWQALQQVVSSRIEVRECVLEAVPRESLAEKRLVWTFHTEMPQEIQIRVVAAILECGVRKGRIRKGDRSLYIWTNSRECLHDSSAKSQPAKPPDWFLDFYERHVMPSSPELIKIRPLVEQIRALSSEGLLHRGEGAFYDGPIKSSLKRRFNLPQEDLLKVHHTIRREAVRYVDHNDPDLAAMEAQHMGVPTNFIDFTTAPMIALFFASRNIVNDGRVISIPTEHGMYSVLLGTKSSHNRINAQRGVFVESPTGVISDGWIANEIKVPKWAKPTVTSYLEEVWKLDRYTMFRDLSGLADEVNNNLIRFPHAIFADGKCSLEIGDYTRAISRFSEYIESSVAQRRHLHLGGSFNKPAYFNRAIAFHSVGNIPAALADLESAKEIELTHPSQGGPKLEMINKWLRRLGGGKND